MAITNGNLPVGTRLVADYKKTRYVCTVEQAEEGEGVVYALEDGKKFKSPSAAGSAVMGGTACNGWRFWTVEGEEPEAKEKPAKAKRPKAENGASKRVFTNLRLTPHQRGVPEGQARWFCSSCQKGFYIASGESPEACPEGHAAEVEDELAAEA